MAVLIGMFVVWQAVLGVTVEPALESHAERSTAMLEGDLSEAPAYSAQDRARLAEIEAELARQAEQDSFYEGFSSEPEK